MERLNSNKKYDYDYVKRYFHENGCVLLSESYSNTKEKLKYICVCGNITSTTFGRFKNGGRCIPCGIRKGSQNHKHKIHEVREIFNKEGCKLISLSFVDARTPLEYICSCGNQSFITLDNFKRGARCKNCGVIKYSAKLRYNIEYVREVFTINGCTLLSKEYKNTKEPLDYICICGKHRKITFYDFKSGQKCWDCGRKKLIDSHRFDYSYVANFFKDNGCTLLTENYINTHQSLDYICKCGKQSKIKFDKFKLGQRCEECGNKKISESKKGVPRLDMHGENNPNYNFEMTDDEREIKRNFPEYRQWVKEIFKRDNYTCKCCGVRGGYLTAHHLDGYNWCREKRTDINNGITLCDDCHNDFHHTYGWRDNTKEQFEEFYKDFILDNFNIVI